MTGTFTAGAVLTAANLNTALNGLTLNAQSGAGYTLVLADAGKLVTLSNASAQNLTIPLNSSVAYATGTVIELLNISTGTWTIVPTGGVTLTGTTSVPTSARIVLTKTGTDTWYGSVLGGGGLTFVASSTFSASSAVSLNNCFTAAAQNYRVNLDLTAASGTDVAVNLRMRASAADDTSANYNTQRLYQSQTTVGGVSDGSGNTAVYISTVTTGDGALSTARIDLVRPQLAQPTLIIADSYWKLSSSSATFYQDRIGAAFKTTAQFDGFTIYPASGTITGTVRVYAYANS